MNFKQIIGKLLGYTIGTLYRCVVSIFPSNRTINLGSNPTVALALYGGLGDALMMLPAIKMAKVSVPGLKLIVYVEEKTAFTILELTGLTDHLMLMDLKEFDNSFKRWRFVWSHIRPLGPNIAMRNYLHTRFQDSVETFLTGAKHRIGYMENPWTSIDTAIAHTKPQQHRVLDNADLFAICGVKGDLKMPKLHLDPESTRWAQETPGNIINNKIIIGMHPGCKSRDKVKRWPEEYFAQLIDRLYIHETVEIILFGGPNDGSSIQHILNKVHRHPILAVSQSLRETAPLVKECDIFVSNDSGLMHLAAVLRVPVVGLFGPTSPIKNGPWGSGHKILMSDYECAPCWAPGYRGCENGDCMKRISVDSAYNAISEKMQSKLTLS